MAWLVGWLVGWGRERGGGRWVASVLLLAPAATYLAALALMLLDIMMRCQTRRATLLHYIIGAMPCIIILYAPGFGLVVCLGRRSMGRFICPRERGLGKGCSVLTKEESVN
ncbi:hypothetical protein F5144DRAFT_21181 [Chaetomium tenue]|uniref:Uncharacterized protein n=1 Tax=Chaetomium tenue TaxID=1854479 RepID=A0ACB7PKK8_9PEZI|nr:hypothetical protein F5144DRAFT_21181 [Chaetomium globosum]